MKTATLLNNIARYGLLAIAVLITLFALVAGSNDYGGGLLGIIKNSPNALPWILLLLLVLSAWKWKLLGGITLFVYGLGLVYFFNFSGPNFWWSTFIATSLVPVLASFFVISWLLQRSSS